MTKRNLIIAIPIVAILLNGLGYLLLVKMRASPPAFSIGQTSGRPAPREIITGSGADPEGLARRPEAPAANDPAAREAEAQTRRAAGLTALEKGEYEKALINFTEAKALIGDKANVGDLLKVTEELRRKPTLAANTRSAPPPEPMHRASPRLTSRRVAVREEAMVESRPSAPQASGLLIVTTNPRGLLVHVDDTPVDLTPMKTKVNAGTHRVVLMDGDRSVYETTVEVREGGTATVVRDLPTEKATETPRPAATTPPAARPSIREEPTRPTPPTPAASLSDSLAPGTTPKEATTSSQAGSAGDVGVLEISSPGLYGVVWVNGRPRGYPPLTVRDLPTGPAKVEVRVNGVQKRMATATVKAGSTTSIKLRSLEGAP